MKPENRCMGLLAGITLMAFSLLASSPGRGAPSAKVDQTIQYLISYVSSSEMTFIRNAREYSAGEAAEHMSKKYQHFKGDIETPDDFIVRCATKSLLTGKPYLVVNKRGVESRTSNWLKTELTVYRARNR